MFYKLIKETDTKIHVGTEEMEVPGTECVHINPQPLTIKDLPESSHNQITPTTMHSYLGVTVGAYHTQKSHPTHTITFENGHIEKCYLLTTLPTILIFEKN